MILPKLQWHITNRCNCRCTHCYQDTYDGNDEVNFEKMKDVLTQFKEWIDFNRTNDRIDYRASISVTGGEPFIREDFFNLLWEFKANKKWMDFSIMSNGMLIDINLARKVKLLGPSHVQVSIEGKKETHDLIRGEGSYDGAIEGIKNLVKSGISTSLSFTAHAKNFKEFPDVVNLGNSLGVGTVWTDRLIPCGDELLSMTIDETKQYLEMIGHQRLKMFVEDGTPTVRSHRALQFMNSSEKPYSCKAGQFLTIMPNGDLYPCRRMPIKVGNVFEKPILELYEDEIMKELRNPTAIIKGCEECKWVTQCKGGLRCLSYAVNGDPFISDPGCYLSNKEVK